MKKMTTRELEQLRLSQEYNELTNRLEECRANFNFVTDADAIDALIFEENSILARMAALSKEARSSGYRVEPF